MGYAAIGHLFQILDNYIHLFKVDSELNLNWFFYNK